MPTKKKANEKAEIADIEKPAAPVEKAAKKAPAAKKPAADKAAVKTSEKPVRKTAAKKAAAAEKTTEEPEWAKERAAFGVEFMKTDFRLSNQADKLAVLYNGLLRSGAKTGH